MNQLRELRQVRERRKPWQTSLSFLLGASSCLASVLALGVHPEYGGFLENAPSVGLLLASWCLALTWAYGQRRSRLGWPDAVANSLWLVVPTVIAASVLCATRNASYVDRLWNDYWLLIACWCVAPAPAAGVIGFTASLRASVWWFTTSFISGVGVFFVFILIDAASGLAKGEHFSMLPDPLYAAVHYASAYPLSNRSATALSVGALVAVLIALILLVRLGLHFLRRGRATPRAAPRA